MSDEKKKMTAHGSSVGADDGQSISQNSIPLSSSMAEGSTDCPLQMIYWMWATAALLPAFFPASLRDSPLDPDSQETNP